MLWQKKIKNPLLRNTITLSAGTAIASSIPILLQPLLRNIYSPEEFGLYSVYLSIVGVIVVISTFKYETVVLLPENDHDSLNVAGLAVVISLLLNSLIFLTLLFTADNVLTIFRLPASFKPWLFFIPVSSMLFSAFNVFNYWMIREKVYRYSSYCRIIRRGSEGAGQLGLSKVSLSGTGLILGDIIGHTFNLLFAILFSRRHGLRARRISFTGMMDMLLKYKDYAIYNTLPTLFNTLTIAMPIFLVNKLYSESETGQLDLARLFLFIPLVLFSEPLSQVLFKNFREKFIIKRSILPEIIRISKILVILSIIGLVLTILFADSFVVFLFGEKWTLAGDLMEILVFSLSLRFIIDPFRFVFAAFERIKLLSIWQVIYFLSISSLVLVQSMDIISFVRLLVIFESACYIIFLLLIIMAIRDYERYTTKA